MSTPSQTNDHEQGANMDSISSSSRDVSNSSSKAGATKQPLPPTPQPDSQNDTPPSPKKPSLLSRAWTSLGITPAVFTIMFKPALSATIAMAIYQKRSVAENYLNLGYVIIIISIITVPILPRGKYLMNLGVCVFLTCFACGMVFLGIFAGVKAREHSTPSDAPRSVKRGYNSSAAVVNAIFLMINIFGINTLRATRPALKIPAIHYTIFILIGFSYGPQEPTMYAARRFTKELLYAFLTGQGISTAVALFIIPVSSRKVFFGGTIGFLQSCRGLLKTQLAFVRALNRSGVCDPGQIMDYEHKTERRADFDAKLATLKAASTGILTLGAKLRDDVTFAKRETAYGNLTETDIHQIHQHLVAIMMPISGLSTIGDIAGRMASNTSEEGQLSSESEPIFDDGLSADRQEWLEMMDTVHETFDHMIQLVDDGIQHVLISLRLVPSPKANLSEDVEKGANTSQPGQIGFGDYMERKIGDFKEQRTTHLRQWAEERGLSSIFQATAFPPQVPSADITQPRSSPSGKIRELQASKRLHIILYMEYLLHSVAQAVLSMVRFSELKLSDGTFAKKHFIFPKLKTVIKVIKGLISGDDIDPTSAVDQSIGQEQKVYLGAGFQAPKDPEHLPPKSKWQVFGNYLRCIPRYLGSDEVRFGVRVTLAVMSIGILCFLRNTHVFYIKQRVVWALVMIAIGMNPTSGSAVFILLGNLVVTVSGMITAFVNWYIVDGKTGGVIALFPFFLMFYFYFVAKYPRFLIPIAAGCLTHVLVIGYELQVRVIGEKIATSTGQPYYPIYKLAPYRVLAVLAGVVIAYIWTIFPVPITEGSVLRRDLGASLFLLGSYLSAVTSTVDLQLGDQDGDGSHERRLEKLRRKALEKEIVLLNGMRQNLAFLPWEPRVGGDFPTEIYGRLVEEVWNVTNYLTIIAYATSSFPSAKTSSPWLSLFAASRRQSTTQSHQLTTLLALLSAALTNGTALPPYLKTPEHFRITDELASHDDWSHDENMSHDERLRSGDAGVKDDRERRGVLHLGNLNEPGFRAVAVIEVAQRAVVGGTERIRGLIRELVGELDFGGWGERGSVSSTLVGDKERVD